jgi:hypothetical protein
MGAVQKLGSNPINHKLSQNGKTFYFNTLIPCASLSRPVHRHAAPSAEAAPAPAHDRPGRVRGYPRAAITAPKIRPEAMAPPMPKAT